MSGAQGADSTHDDVFEIRRAAQDEVCAAALVCGLLVAILAGAAGEEKPALQGVTPRC